MRLITVYSYITCSDQAACKCLLCEVVALAIYNLQLLEGSWHLLFVLPTAIAELFPRSIASAITSYLLMPHESIEGVHPSRGGGIYAGSLVGPGVHSS